MVSIIRAAAGEPGIPASFPILFDAEMAIIEPAFAWLLDYAAPAVTVDIPALVGSDLAEKAARYGETRDDQIVVDPEIMGGTPVIRGTRMTVYSVLGRLDGGDSIDNILTDNPHVTRAALETAELYARTHPIMGRPGVHASGPG